MKLVILDYTTATVFLYTYIGDEVIDDDWIRALGFDPDNCHWMTGDIDFIERDSIFG